MLIQNSESKLIGIQLKKGCGLELSINRLCLWSLDARYRRFDDLSGNLCIAL